ncbi:hypothetical protein O6H91_Y481500 [Diphasiastrum complanatum]|nr:hypothetical protein O6H91_Y481500 [Diphasiastrum complanatum]
MEDNKKNAEMSIMMIREDSAAAGHTEVKADKPLYHRRRILICCGATVCTTIAVILILVIVSLTLFKAKQPTLHVDSVLLSRFSAGLNSNSLLPTIEIVFDLNASVYNPNRASFQYTNSTTYGLYHGSVVAEAPIPAGKISARGTETISTQVSVKADRLLANPNLLTDFNSQFIPISTTTVLTGRVTILGFIKRHAKSTSTCDMVISVSNQTIQNYQCSNKLKL